MGSNNQLKLQIVRSQLLELDIKYDNVTIILKNALNIILTSSISDKFLKKGVIMLVEENSGNLKLVAHKNVSFETINSCKKIAFNDCDCSTAALTKNTQFVVSNKNGFASYSVPLVYENNLLGVLTIYLSPNHKKNNEEITALETISNTLSLIINKKRSVRYHNFIKTKLDNCYGLEYFKVLAKFLSNELGMKYCLIGYFNEKHEEVNTITNSKNCKIFKNFSYPLKDSPCENVIESNYCFYPDKLQQLFPNDTDLVKLGVQSYFGFLINNIHKKPIGLIAFMHDKPINNEDFKLSVISNFIARLSSECERHTLELEKKNEEKKYKVVIESLNDVFVRATFNNNGEYIIQEISPSIYKMSGVHARNIIGKNTIFNTQSNLGDDFKERLFSEKEIIDYPTSVVNKKGNTIHILISSKLFTDDNGKPLEVITFIKDVTEKKNNEIRKEISYIIAKKSKRRVINLQSLANFIYTALQEVMDMKNFSIVLMDKVNETLDFPVFIDEHIKINKKYYSRPIENEFIEHIISTNQEFIKTEVEISRLLESKKISYKLKLPKILIAIPLKLEGVTVGLIQVKSYTNEHLFSKSDIELLQFIGTQLSTLLERDKWQTDLINKEKYFRSLVESSHSVTGIIDQRGMINYISESVKTILGFNSHNLIGRNFYDFIPSRHHSISKNGYEDFLLNKKIENPYYAKVIVKDKSERTIEYTLNNQLNNKEIKGVIFNAQDITEKSLYKKKLEQSLGEIVLKDKNYKTIFNNANDGIVRINKDFKILESNDRLSKIFGLSKKTILDHSLLSFFENKYQKNVLSEISKIKSRLKSSTVFENVIVKGNKKKIICKVFVKGIFVDNQLDYYIVFFTDITKRVKAIKEIIALKIAIEKTANVLYIDLKGNILYASRKVFINTGYTKKELMGGNVSVFNSDYHPKEFFKEMWQTVLQGKVWNGEIKNKMKDGELYWLFMAIIPIKNVDNKVEYFINVRHDITELKQNRLEKVKEVIDAQEKEKENFAKELHDGLGQMLLASKMNLTAIKDEMVTLDKSTQEVYDNSLRLLTEAIHEARNVSHGLMSRTLVQFGLSFAINDMIRNLESNQSTIQFKYTQNINEQRFDEEIEKGLYRVSQELISNIIKHSGATSAEMKIIKKGKKLHISVKDNGVGITKNILNPGKSLGIGLKNIETRINYLSGTFMVNENFEKGTEFNIIVPLNTLVNA